MLYNCVETPVRFIDNEIADNFNNVDILNIDNVNTVDIISIVC